MDKAELALVLDRLAAVFENAEQPVPGLQGSVGWGQFLDDPVFQKQTGPYGTSAGLIVSGLAGRGAAALTARLTGLPNLWWQDWQSEQGDGYRLLSQTLRLAFFYLALTVSKISEETSIRSSVRQELLRRALPSGMWGDYDAKRELKDPTPRLFCSSIVVLCLSLHETLPTEASSQLELTLTGIERGLLGDKDLPLLHAAAAAAAILCTRGPKASRKVMQRIRKIAWSLKAHIGDLGVYFYDFQYRDASGNAKFGRDYFIVPTEVLVGIGGYQRGAPTALRQRAEAAVKALLANIKANAGVYKPDASQRVSSKNQAWAALLLARAAELTPSRISFGGLWYELLKERAGNWFTEYAFPLISLISITAEIVFFRDLGALVNVLTGLGGIVVSALYGPTFLKKWFPGR